MSNPINFQEIYNILENDNIQKDNKINYIIDQIEFDNIHMTNKEFNNILNLASVALGMCRDIQ